LKHLEQVFADWTPFLSLN